ncbi:hypothetical protein BZA05DRAFT_32347 [Tricharina praecox]|uniref:uncharacterized protein n=1 Tax=Tricharina praecox TaxID=43433 RepID=UPI0022208A9C|nr:uncharacterized protein BZA05DRAFT_32347 [Tricharina praecox]KAI5853539.1 hypothetical protein BZA05DRAFT_32347 [Tricharina praecox]
MPILTPTARAAIASAVLSETPDIISTFSSAGATADSSFHLTLAPLPAADSPSLPAALTRVVNLDTYSAARAMIRDGAVPSETAVLNLASDLEPAGGWKRTLLETQEEALCYSSTLYATLREEWYPWANSVAGGIWSPGVVVHRDTLANECKRLPDDEVLVLGVVTIAAPRWQRVRKGEFADPVVREGLLEKVRAVLRMAAGNGRRNLVLGAMGCGAYGCPPAATARDMAAVVQESEFKGWFERVWWAVVDPLGEGNGKVFTEACEGLTVGGGPAAEVEGAAVE